MIANPNQSASNRPHQAAAHRRFRSALFALLSVSFSLAGTIPAVADLTIYQDLFTTPGSDRGGSYTSSIGGTAPTTRDSDGTTSYGASTWTFNGETNGWGQTGSGVATPTSSNYLAFTPQRGRFYVLSANIDATNWGNGEWFTIGFTSQPINWVPGNYVADLNNNLVRGGQSRAVSVTLDTRDAGWTNSQGLAYAGWFTDVPGSANLPPGSNVVKVSNFSLVIQNPCVVTYDRNGADSGSVPVDGNVYSAGAAVMVQGNTGGLVKANHNFNGWNTAVDGSGTAYTPGSTLTIGANITLFAQWTTANTFTVTYSGNGSTGGSVPVDSTVYAPNATVTVLGNTGNLSKSGYLFVNWNTTADGNGTPYAADDTFSISSSVTLYAHWLPYDVAWNNGANTGNWNTVDANWTGCVWSNTVPNNAVIAYSPAAAVINLTESIVAGTVAVGNGTNNASYTLQGGGGSLAAGSFIVQASGANGAGAGTANLTDLNLTTTGNLGVGRWGLVIGGASSINVGGQLGGAIAGVASADWGILTIQDSAAVTAAGGVNGNAEAWALHLNGGTLTTPSIQASDRESGGAALLVFNGTQVIASQANPTFVTVGANSGGSNSAFVGNGGVLIDSAGHDIGIGVNLKPSGGATGGLTKSGGGTLSLTGTNTYTGHTVVQGGVLSIGTTGSLPGGILSIASGAKVDLNFSGTASATKLVLNGVTQSSGTWGSNSSTADHKDDTWFSGTGVLNVLPPPTDLTWDNGAATGGWNGTDENWSGWVWSSSLPNNAFFTTVGGSVMLDSVAAGSVNVGNTGINFPSSGFGGTSLTATSLTVQGYSGNGGNYGANPMLTLNIDTVAITGDVAVGRANLTVSGGAVTVGRIVTSTASADWGRVVIAGGTVTATNGVDGSLHTGATFQLDLNGGELRTPSVRVADREVGYANDAWLTFNGGTLTATGADNADFITTYGGGHTTFVGYGGAVVDTNGRNIGLTVNMVRSGSSTGGLTKNGTGTLTLGGAVYNYRGNTVINDGALNVSSGSEMEFRPTTNGTTNSISAGSPTATLSFLGQVYLDLSAANATGGNSWNLFNVASFSTAPVLTPILVNSSLGVFNNNAGVWTRTDGSNTWTFTEATGVLSLAVAPPDPFANWINTNWPDLTDKTAGGDPDQDGIPNLLEYVLYQGDPSLANPVIQPTLDASGADFVFTFHRRAASTADTTQVFQYSTDMGPGNWIDVAIPSAAAVVTPDTPTAGVDEVVITIPKEARPVLFGRLSVTKP